MYAWNKNLKLSYYISYFKFTISFFMFLGIIVDILTLKGLNDFATLFICITFLQYLQLHFI